MRRLRTAAPLVALLPGLSACSADEQPPSEPEEVIVGLVPYSVNSDFCPTAANRESAYFRMDDENDTRCSIETGDFGEGAWVSPSSPKYPRGADCATFRNHTLLRFCRTSVAADAFRPLTLDPLAREQFYAVLRFGDRCPAQSMQIVKTIINEDVANENDPVHSAELLRPNEITDDARGNFTRLFFCYFRNARHPSETMREFPDLGFPYAVFHDFDGTQPGWVMQKRYLRSDDSNQTGPVNSYDPAPGLSQEASDFLEIIENPIDRPAYDTYFDLARVR